MKGELLMNKRHHIIGKCFAYLLIMAMIIGTFSWFAPVHVSAASSKGEIEGKYYEKAGSSFKVPGSGDVSTKDNSKTLGKLYFNGSYTMQNGDYVLADDESFTLSYTMDQKWLLANTGASEWHLTSNDGKSAAGISLGSKVGKAAIIVQNSSNGSNWKTVFKKGDVFGKETETQFYGSQNDNITNGAYYKVYVAYEFCRKTGTKKELFKTKDVYESKYCLEVYEFYVRYADSRSWEKGNKRLLASEPTAKKLDSGFSTTITLGKNDPHFGWNLGGFYAGGYTTVKMDGDTPVLLKNVGDEISVWFELADGLNIDKLNGKSGVIINSQSKASDNYFGLKNTDFGKGMFIIRKTDADNKKEEPVKHRDFIASMVSVNSDKPIYTYEEGDYEAVLDYQIKQPEGKNVLGKEQYGYFDYQIKFEFKVRNGDCNGFLFEVDSSGNRKGEILNNAHVSDGFMIDLAKSRYLNVEIKRDILTKNGDFYSRDTRSNQVSESGKIYKEPGIYTITVKNDYVENPTVKVVYVGDDPLLKAFVDAGYSVEKMVDTNLSKVDVDEMGRLISVETKKVIEETTKAPEVVETKPDENVTEAESKADETVKKNQATKSTKDKKSTNIVGKVILVIVVVLVVGIGLFTFAGIKSASKKGAGHDGENDKKE